MTIQFVMIGFIAVFGTIPHHPVTILVFCGSGLLGLWALRTMGNGNIRIRPEPLPDVRLVLAGPYRLIRHPMYTSVLGLTGAFLFPLQLPTILAWIVLLIVLLAKMFREERMMKQRFAAYSDYCQRSWRLLPYIF